MLPGAPDFVCDVRDVMPDPQEGELVGVSTEGLPVRSGDDDEESGGVVTFQRMSPNRSQIGLVVVGVGSSPQATCSCFARRLYP